MKKKISYLIIFLIALICFNEQASALDCEYKGDYNLKFTINDDGTISSSTINDKTIKIDNWDEKLREGKSNEVDFTGKDFFNKTNECPPYALYGIQIHNDHFVFLSDSEHLEEYQKFSEEKATGLFWIPVTVTKETYLLELKRIDYNLIGKKIQIKYNSNNSNATGMMQSEEIVYQENMEQYKLKKNGFKFEGYIPMGWMVNNGNGWLCNLENGTQKYTTDCSEDNRVIIPDESFVTFYIDGTSLNLYMKWMMAKDISAVQINHNNLGKSACETKNYVWNKEGYCNTDNLQYVMCGDAHDIPAQLPSLISMAVNLLKIATPIVLIIVSIITLVKAIMSSKEDEIKKGQQSLIRKVIAAIIIFMIISMVQFVVLKVADDNEQTSISACMSCFLNNDCEANKYFKTNISGTDYCSKVSDKGKSSEVCDNFYRASQEFSCKVDKYTLVYSNSGTLKSVSGDDETYTAYLNSDFTPKNESECPTDLTATVSVRTEYHSGLVKRVTVAKKTSPDFSCKVDKYTLVYSASGTLKSVSGDGETYTNNLNSDFTPKNESECPTGETAIVSVRTEYHSGLSDYVYVIKKN